MKFVNKKHERAIKLKREIDKVDREHETFLNNLARAESKTKSSTSRKAWGKFLEAGEAEFNTKEDKLYREYYDLMNKEFDVNKSKIKFTDKKYKDKFMDEKYINDMFKAKTKEKVNAKATKKKR